MKTSILVVIVAFASHALSASFEPADTDELFAAIMAGSLEQLADCPLHPARGCYNASGMTPLLAAVLWDHVHVAQLLMDMGAEVDEPNADGTTTPLQLAVELQKPEMLGALLDRHARTECSAGTILHWAVEMDKPQAVGFLAAHVPTTATDHNGATPLHVAAGLGFVGVMEELLRHGADFAAVDPRGWTPLYWAVHQNHLEAVKLLVGIGAPVDAICAYGHTPCQIAEAEGHTHVAEYLRAWDPHADLLHTAAARGQANVIDYLLDHGAEIDDVSGFGWTPLHLAVLNNHYTATALLLARGAATDIPDYDGFLPLVDAIKLAYTDVAKALISAMPSVDIVDCHGSTPLHYAIRFYRPLAFKALLRKATRLDIPNANGRTPRQLAVDTYRTEFVHAIDLRAAQLRPTLRERLGSLINRIRPKRVDGTPPSSS